MSGECEACGEHCLDCTCGATTAIDKAMVKSCVEVLNSLISIYEGSLERLATRCERVDKHINESEERLKSIMSGLDKKISSFKGSYTKQISEAEKLLEKIRNHIGELENE